MALYRLEAKIIGRKAKGAAGKPIPGKQVSIVAKAAYRSGEKLRDDRTEQIFDYRSRSQEVVHSEIIAPEQAPEWMSSNRARLWNSIEKAEKRSDSQLAREFIVAMPVELSETEQVDAVRQWCKAELVSKGFVADFALHRSKDGKNPHAHILVTMRPVEGEGFGKKPDTAGKFNGRGAVGLNGKSELDAWRASWEKQANGALERAGERARVDRRSLKDRGIDRTPEPKIGVDATAMKRKGLVADPERVKAARWSRVENQVRAALRAVRRNGEIKQHGAGSSWWERAQIAVGRVRGHAREMARSQSSSWRSYVQTRSQQPPPPQRGIEPSR